MFNPPGTTSTPRSFADLILGPTGASTGSILAQGNGHVAGSGDMVGFAAVFTGSFVVAQAGSYTINATSQDGFIFGVGNGAARVSGVNVNPPASGLTAFSQYPVMAANNGVSTGAASPIVLSFPAAGSYPYEFDYKSGTGGPLSFTVTTTQGSSSSGVRPLESLVLTSSTASPITGQPASFTLQATDETGAPIPSLPITVNVAGIAPHTLLATTNTAGLATVSYAETAAMTDVLQASATLNGLAIVSNQSTLTWTTNNPPSITVAGNSLVTLPGTATYTATVTDPVAPAGGPITVNWTEVSGPGTVSFDAQTLPVTDALFPAPGSYILQITATDSLGATSLQIPVTVNPPVTTDQGWILSPIEHAQVTGLVPITLIVSETLASGTLTYYPLSNPSAVVTMNANTTTAGGGTIATLDTTLLPNGSYYVVLDATDTTGKTMGSGVDIVVGGNYKPGRVTTTVTDLVVPAPGLPIQISRTYDSLVSGTSSDFGYGWSLSINLQMQIASTNDVTFTINGQQKTFYFTPPPQGFSFIYTPQYTAEPGFFGTLQASASNCSGNLLVKTGSVYICAIGYAPYQPTTLVYTDPYGRAYTASGTGALQSMQDLANNTLTVTPTGITASNGLSVPFVRDTPGRITQITDPLGNVYAYAYDSFGNLASVTYPGITTPAQYTYNTTHLYTGGTDPRGNALPSTTYDSSGRLQTVTDALSQTTSYAYNVAGNTTTTTYPPDANGNTGTATMVYDSYGMLLTSTDPLGNTTTNTYDANHNLLSVTDPLGHTTSYTYDSSGNKTSKTYPKTATSVNTMSMTVYNPSSEPTQTTDELGNARNFTYDATFWPKSASDSIGPVASFTFNANGTIAAKAIGYDLTATAGVSTTYIYDAYGNMTSQADPLGRQTQYTYDTLGRLSSTTAPAGGVTTNTYDALGHLKTSAQPLGRNSSYTYDPNGNKLSETDANGNTTSYQYDALNRVTQATYPTSPATTMAYTYDFRNNATKTTDQAGHVTNNVYDLAGRLTSMTAAFGTAQAATTAYAYYNDGRKETATDPLGYTTTYNYDAAGRLTSAADAQSNTTQYAYDDAGNQISTLDPNLHKTLSQYDARSRLSKTIYDDSTITLYSYDGPGNLVSLTDQASNTVQHAYDAANQLKSVIQTASPNPQNTTGYSYDPNGNLANLTDANSHTTQNGFDTLNQLKQETLPVGQTQTRTYDATGNLISLTDYNGKTTTYASDALNRLLSKAPDPSLTDTPESFTYTTTGKRASMTDASGATTYTYDSLDRLITKATPQGTLNYTYDAAGNIASMSSSNANGVSVAYTYDDLNRLNTVADNRLPVGQNTTTYSYGPTSNMATATYPNGLQATFTYDDLNRITALNATKASYNYTLSPTGNRQSAVESSGRKLNWSYDSLYRLTNETISLDPHSKNGSVGYGLDPVGNRLNQTSTLPGISAGSFTYDPDDRLSTETFDNNGNTLVSGASTFAYDFENRLKSMNGGAVTVQYDGDGNRVAKTASGVTTRYLVDDLNPTGYAQVVEEVVSGSVERTYTHGLQRIDQNQLINSAWTPSFYGYDGFGSVRTLTDSTGTVTDTYDYDAWGNVINSTGTTPNSYQYRNEQFELDLGLYYLRARYFNPVTGRFLSRDPEEGEPTDPITLHRYLYAASNPISNLDPSGRATLAPGGAPSIGAPPEGPAGNPNIPGVETPKTPGRQASEYAMLLAAVALNIGVAIEIYRSGKDIACTWEHAEDWLEIALIQALISTNSINSISLPPPGSDNDTQQAGGSCRVWKCLLTCTVRQIQPEVDLVRAQRAFFGVGDTPRKACVAAQKNGNGRFGLFGITNIRLKHCDFNDPKVWR
jgi:RHS repeat-associated protein